MPPQQARRSAPPPSNSVECTPNGCAQMCATCLMFLLSLTTISAMGVIAGGAFWSAQALHKITDGHNVMQVSFCGVPGDKSANGTRVDEYNHKTIAPIGMAEWDLLQDTSKHTLVACPRFHENNK